jgi:O-succinylbenzoate synthase
MFHLAAEIEQRAISFTDGASSGNTVPLNGLLIGTEEHILRQVTLFVNQGYRSVKLKVGRQSIDQDIALVYRVHARLGGKATLRLDANRAWTLEQALTFGKAIEVLDVEYIEEPLQNSQELPLLAQRWRLPIALDESLVEQGPDTLKRFDRLKALILKPTLLGGFTKALAWAKWAEANEVMPVTSSSFETDLGLTMLGHFAAQVAPGIPCGLDTSNWFKENLLQRPLPISAGHLQLDSQRTITLDIRTDRLTEVYHA